ASNTSFPPQRTRAQCSVHRGRCCAGLGKKALVQRKNPGCFWDNARPPTRHRKPTRMTPQTSFPKQDIRVVLFEGISQRAVDVFHDAGYRQVELLPRSLTGDELIEKVSGAHIIGIRSRTQVTAEVVAQARKLITIGCFCIGTNQVDLEAAQLAGIPVFNAPYSNTRSVAELVVAEA